MGLGDFAPATFLDNPLISAMAGAAINAAPQGPVAAVAAQMQPQQPKVAPVKAPVPADQTDKLRTSMDVRQRYNNRQPAGGATRGTMPGAGMNMPGVMSPQTLMNPEVQKLLAPYGVSPEQATSAAQGASPNLFITNPEAYQKHPVLAGMIERGLEGLAFTKGSRTVGEGLSNVAQGMLDAQGARAEKYNNQLMMPFEQAQQVANLQNISVEQKLKQAQTAYDQSHASYWDALPDLRAQAEQDKADQNKRTDSLKAQLGVMSYVNQHKDFSLLPEEQSKLDDLNKQFGGEIPAAQLQGVYNPAIERYEKQKAADQLQRAQASNATRVKVAGMTADHAADKMSNEDLKKELDVLQTRYKAFETSTNATGDGYDVNGNYVRGKDKQRAANEYIARIDEVTGKLKAVPDAMRTPGTGMTNSAPKSKPHLTYQPDGTFK